MCIKTGSLADPKLNIITLGHRDTQFGHRDIQRNISREVIFEKEHKKRNGTYCWPPGACLGVALGRC